MPLNSKPDGLLLELKGLTKHFPGVIALNAVDLALAPGEIHALVGENGAGKSTLIKLLCGSYVPDAGEMQFNGALRDGRRPFSARFFPVSVELDLQTFASQNIDLGQWHLNGKTR
jgi:ABC-type sugar transport system ATPase subunit